MNFTRYLMCVNQPKKCGMSWKWPMKARMKSKGQGRTLSLRSMRCSGWSLEKVYVMCRKDLHIVNHLLALGKTFDKEELNIKILKSLNRTWQPKVTTIFESRDLPSMNIATLFGKLREHELELERLKEEEDGEKRHTIALKSIVKSRTKLIENIICKWLKWWKFWQWSLEFNGKKVL